MTYQEIIDKWRDNPDTKPKVKRSHKDEEHKIQVSCFKWFNLAYRDLQGLLFAIPNGGRRDKTTAAKLKAEGVVAGVADLMLAVPNKDYHGLFIEMKTEVRGSRQRESQKAFEKNVTAKGYKYSVCRSFDEFQPLIKDYLCNIETDMA